MNRIPNSNANDVALAVKSAKQASVDWQKLTLQERIAWLERIADAMEEKKGEIARLESLDTGNRLLWQQMSMHLGQLLISGFLLSIVNLLKK